MCIRDSSGDYKLEKPAAEAGAFVFTDTEIKDMAGYCDCLLYTSKEGGSAVTALLGFRVEDGSFAHVGGTSDAMASEQGLQALEALRRFYAGEKRFFDMTDAGAPVQWTADSAAAEAVSYTHLDVYKRQGRRRPTLPSP